MLALRVDRGRNRRLPQHLLRLQQSNIKREFVPVLEEGTTIIKSKPNNQGILEGHTDGIGSVQYNMKLGQRRADSVKAFFVKKGH